MDKVQIIETETQNLLDKMVTGASVKVSEIESVFHVDISTEAEAPTVIGRHGETIRAMQKILEVIFFKQLGERTEIVINVNDYREKQVERLEYIASQAAQKVKDKDSATYLRGFSSYERRIMHEYISTKYPELKSFSIGEGRDRRLVVDMKDGDSEEDYYDKPSASDDDLKIEV